MPENPYVWFQKTVAVQIFTPPDGVISLWEAEISLKNFFSEIWGEYSEYLESTILNLEKNILWCRNIHQARRYKKSARELRNILVQVELQKDASWIVTFEAYVKREIRADETIYRKVKITFDQEKSLDTISQELEYELSKVDTEDSSLVLSQLHAHWIRVSKLQKAYSGGLPGLGKRHK